MPLLTSLILATPGNLPGSPYCFTTAQKLNEDIINNALFEFQSNIGNSYFNYGSTVPTPENEIYPWFRVGFGFLDGWYTYDGGWKRPHPSPPSSGERRLWVGSVEELVTYDGGDATNGAMWLIDTDFDGRFLVGPGTLPGYQATPVPTPIAVGVNGGAEGQAITLTTGALPPHRHDIGVENLGDLADNENGRLQVSDGGLKWMANDSTSVGHTRLAGGTSGVAVPINVPTLPPFRGIFVIMRSARVNYIV